jgi:catechol 2,3-dioxygenase-like lactoylglutathione lyase family enzyme
MIRRLPMLAALPSKPRTLMAATIALTSWLPLLAAGAELEQVSIAVPSPLQATGWYQRYLDCAAIEGRDNALECGGVIVEFLVQPVLGGSQGTGIDHIAFSVPDLVGKMAALEQVGVSGTGVRLQRLDDGATYREIPGLYLSGFIFDPWGTHIELVQDAEQAGFHHIHLSASNPDATLDWYETHLGGVTGQHKGQERGLRFGNVWLLAANQGPVAPAGTRGRAIDHLAFRVADLPAAVAGMTAAGVVITEAPAVPVNGRSQARQALVSAPDNVMVALVEDGWAGLDANQSVRGTELQLSEAYQVPMTPWGEPDLQGIYTSDAAQGIPLQRPQDIPASEVLSAVEAAARRERGTLSSIWGYEREWRDTTLEYAKDAPLTQVAMIVDPPDGRLPPLTPAAEAARAANAGNNEEDGPALPAGPEDLNYYVRCITQGLPNLMLPTIYNNGLQIVQSPGMVAITKEMIHETRLVPIDSGPAADIPQWLGQPRGHWEGNTLVVETANFNGKSSFQGSGPEMTLTERFTRVSPNVLQYEFTVNDPATWVQPWTVVFPFMRDDSQYELVEYACHEGNYAVSNILSGARAAEQEAAQ